MKERPDIWPGKPEQIAPDVWMYAGYVIKAIGDRLEPLISRGLGSESRLRYKIVSPVNSSAVKELEEYGLVSMQDVVSYVEYERRKLWKEIQHIELLNAAKKFTDGVTREDQKNQS